MVHPAFISVLLLLAGFAVQVVCAQGMAVQSAPLPVIEGKINGMDVVAQGDSVAFFAGKLPREYSDKSCAEDLHCMLHKNHTRAVMISPDGIRLLQLNHLEKDKDEEDDSSSLLLPSMTLNTLDSSSSFIFKELFISTEEIEPTPTLVTLYTGNPVVDQTPGLAWINSETIKLLATTVETMNLLSTSTSSAENESSLIDLAPTETVKVLTTITGELDELRRRLVSSASVPVATPVQTNSGDPELESNEVWLETESDVLKIRPSLSVRYETGNETTSSFTFSVKQVPTVIADTTSENREATLATSDPRSTDSPQASHLPDSKKQKVEGVTTVAQAIKGLGLDISGQRVKETPNDKKEESQDGSPPLDQDTTGNQGAQASGSSGASASGSGGNSGGDEREDSERDKSTDAHYSDNPEIYDLLLKTLENDNLEEFKSILAKHSLSLNAEKDGTFLWEIALGNRKPKVLNFLLSHLKIRLNDNCSATEAMRLAIVNSEVEMVRVLLDAGAKPHTDSVAYAIDYGGENQEELIELLLDAGAEPTTILYGYRNCNIL